MGPRLVGRGDERHVRVPACVVAAAIQIPSVWGAAATGPPHLAGSAAGGWTLVAGCRARRRGTKPDRAWPRNRRRAARAIWSGDAGGGDGREPAGWLLGRVPGAQGDGGGGSRAPWLLHRRIGCGAICVARGGGSGPGGARASGGATGGAAGCRRPGAALRGGADLAAPRGRTLGRAAGGRRLRGPGGRRGCALRRTRRTVAGHAAGC